MHALFLVFFVFSRMYVLFPKRYDSTFQGTVSLKITDVSEGCMSSGLLCSSTESSTNNDENA